MEKKIEDLKYKVLWGNKDIQDSLRYLQDNPSEKKKLINAIKAGSMSKDDKDLVDCIEEGWYEVFDRYDSDIAEQYIYWFRDIILDSNYINCPDGVKRDYMDYKMYTRDLYLSSRRLTTKEQEVVDKSGWADLFRSMRRYNSL